VFTTDANDGDTTGDDLVELTGVVGLTTITIAIGGDLSIA